MAKETKCVYMTMLGSFSISYMGKTVLESRRRDNMSWRLMKYLAANLGRSVTESELRSAVWPTGDEAVCTEGAMRVRLRRLRESLDEIGLGSRRDGLVLYAGSRYRLNPAYEITRDTDEITAMYMYAADTGRDEKTRLGVCRDALALYAGPYLESSLPCEWMELEKAKTRGVFCKLGGLSIELMRQTGDYSAVGLLCDKALLIAPGEYAFQTRLLDFLLETGNTLESVVHYSSLSKLAASSGLPRPPLSAFEKITRKNW